MIERGEEVPADAIILDTSETGTKYNHCYIDMSKITGQVGLFRKHSTSLTRKDRTSVLKNNMPEYRKQLTGKIEYEAPNTNLSSFKGFFKLKTDPKNEPLSIENLLFRGSIIRNTDW